MPLCLHRKLSANVGGGAAGTGAGGTGGGGAHVGGPGTGATGVGGVGVGGADVARASEVGVPTTVFRDRASGMDLQG